MPKSAPSTGRVLTMVLFALSCFGLLLFLWLSFGGSIPLKPKGYRFQAAFPEATQLAEQADVRIAGVSVGKVVSKELDPRGNRTLATIQLDQKFAPIPRDTRAMLRQKTLLGETYVELTPGNRRDGMVPEGATLARSQVKPTVELDEVFDALDKPTRKAFQNWQGELAQVIRGNSQNLNNVFGHLPRFAASADDLLTVLDVERASVRRLFHDGGQVFSALSSDQSALQALVRNSAATFRQTASQDEALASTIQVFPTFLAESKATLARLQTFAVQTDPLVRDLRPVLRDLVPTLQDVRALAPDLRRLFVRLPPLIDAAQTGLPALSQTLDGARPMLAQLGPLLEQLNPILRWLELNQHLTADFIHNGAAGLAATTFSPTSGLPNQRGHYLRQFQPVGAESLAIYTKRIATNRANPYLPPLGLTGGDVAKNLVYPAWDCSNDPLGVHHNPIGAEDPGVPDRRPACYTADLPKIASDRGKQRFPHINPFDYSK